MNESAANDRLAGARLRYQHALRALERQASVLSDLRSRASIVLSATGITASLFGGRALQSHAPGWLNGIALAVVTLGLVACIAVLWPVRDRGTLGGGANSTRRWKATLTFAEVEEATRSSTSEAGMLDALVARLEPAWAVNYATIARRSRVLNAAAVLLVVQVGAWSAALLAA